MNLKLIKKPLNLSVEGIIALLFALCTFNTAKHFVADSSYINGFLVDYLIPAFFLLYLFLVTIFLVVLIKFRKQLIKLDFSNAPVLLIITFFILTVLSGYLSGYEASFIKSSFFLFLLLSLVVFLKLPETTIKKRITGFLIVTPLLFESILGLLQTVFGKNITPYYLFGESSLSLSSSQISRVDFLGKTLLAPYGTFPHPNLLAFYLVFGLLLLFVFKIKLSKISKVTLVLPIICILLTQSLHVVLAVVLSVLYFFLSIKITNFKFRVVLLFLTSIFLFSLLVSHFSFYDSSDSLIRRYKLNNVSFKIVKEHPLFGVGFGNFTRVLENYDSTIGIWERFIQPTHNIYLLNLAESGVLSAIFLFFGFFLLLVKQNGRGVVLVSFVFFASFFDHYLLTLVQGQVLFLLTLTYAFRRIN